MESTMSTVLLILLMVVAFYLLIIRPQQRRKAEQSKLHEALRPGVRVVLSSGVYGNVVEVGERQAVVEIAPGVEVTVLKQVVLQAVTPGSQFAEDTPAEDTPAVDGSDLPAVDGSDLPAVDGSDEVTGERRLDGFGPDGDRGPRPSEGEEKR